MNSATIGIFKKNISQMKVQAPTCCDRITADACSQPLRAHFARDGAPPARLGAAKLASLEAG
jgi:hypothetical protein